MCVESAPATNVNNGNITQRPVVSINNMLLRQEEIGVRHHAQECLHRADRQMGRQTGIKADEWMATQTDFFFF